MLDATHMSLNQLIEFSEGCIRFQIDFSSPGKGKYRLHYTDFYDAVLGKRFDSTFESGGPKYLEELYRFFVVLGASKKSSQVSQTNFPTESPTESSPLLVSLQEYSSREFFTKAIPSHDFVQCHARQTKLCSRDMPFF
jgi:hypothetical protein